MKNGHITTEQKAQIADLRKQNVSFVKIALQTGISEGTCKTIFYKARTGYSPSVKGSHGKFISVSRTGPGRRPSNGLEAASDKARAAAYRSRRQERLQAVADNMHGATSAELAASLVAAIRDGNEPQVKAVVSTLHERYCAIL